MVVLMVVQWAELWADEKVDWMVDKTAAQRVGLKVER